MRRPFALAAALALPLAGLGVSWAAAEYASRQGTVWHVPITGYDPRDILRGHYVIYTYDWPGLEPAARDRQFGDTLCLEGNAPHLTRVFPPQGRPCAAFVTARGGWNDPEGGLASGRLYVAQERATELERGLADPALQGMVRIRVRADGHLTPLDITFRERDGEAAQTTRNER